MTFLREALNCCLIGFITKSNVIFTNKETWCDDTKFVIILLFLVILNVEFALLALCLLWILFDFVNVL